MKKSKIDLLNKIELEYQNNYSKSILELTKILLSQIIKEIKH